MSATEGGQGRDVQQTYAGTFLPLRQQAVKEDAVIQIIDPLGKAIPIWLTTSIGDRYRAANASFLRM